MLDQTDMGGNGVRRSLMDLPRKLGDYQRAQCNRGEKNDSVIIDALDATGGRSNLGGTYHQRQSVESHQIGIGGGSVERHAASPFSSIAEDKDGFDRDLNARMQTMEANNKNFMNMLHTGNN